MKPTKEIIELSKKLHELGRRQEIKHGDWFVNPGDVCYLNDHHHTVVSSIPIVVPSLEDGLLWLKITFDHMIELYSDAHGFWICDYLREKGYTKEETPHEAVLKAMVQVLEEK